MELLILILIAAFPEVFLVALLGVGILYLGAVIVTVVVSVIKGMSK